jgi:hypothetical protein
MERYIYFRIEIFAYGGRDERVMSSSYLFSNQEVRCSSWLKEDVPTAEINMATKGELLLPLVASRGYNSNNSVPLSECLPTSSNSINNNNKIIKIIIFYFR